MTNVYKKIVAWTTILSLAGLSVIQTATLVYAQNYTTSRLKCPDYQFTRTLAQDSRGEDVRLIQSILNLDYRTRVAPSGVGSKGYETDLFGIATREALKRFQALFIELIGVADGKFNARTITVMNAVCQGNYFKNGSGGVYDSVGTATSTASNIDKTAPVISISAPAINYTDSPFRMWIVANEPIQSFSLDKFIALGGATLSDLRKENASTYKVLVTPGQTATHTATFQLEAESIKDLAGNVNQNASNELNISFIPRPVGPDVVAPTVLLSSGSLGVMTINTDGSIPSIVMTLSFSEDIVGNINISNFVITGPIRLSDFKKLDNKTYSFSVNTSVTARSSGSIQLPAGVVADAVGNKNTLSNQYLINILPIPQVATDTTVYNPPTYNSGSGSDSSDQSNPMNMLMYLMIGSQALKGLTSLLGSNPFGGGASGAGAGANTGITNTGTGGSTGSDLGGIVSGASGVCSCPGPALGRQTAYVQSTGPGPSGAYITMGLSVTGCVKGKYNPPVVPCGQKFVNGVCQGPNLDSLGRQIVGTIIPAVTQSCN
jgi:hypothetical protein